MADSGTDDRDERGERFSDRVSAPPPEFDDGPAGETRQTPKDELARWRRMAARGGDRAIEGVPSGPFAPNTPLEAGHDPASVTVPALDARQLGGGHHEVTRAVLDPSAPLRRSPEPPTRELQLSSDMVALSRPETGLAVPLPRHRDDPTGSLPPRAPPPRPALRPIATSVPPELPVMPDAPPLGVHSPSLPPYSVAPRRAAPRYLAPLIAIGLIGVASGIAVAVVLWPDESDPFAPTPADPSTPTAPEPAPAIPSTATNPSTPTAPTSADALVTEGDADLAARDYTAALAAYERAIALDPHEAHAFEGAARACIALSRGEDAVRYAERAVAHRQRRVAYRVLLGDAHVIAGHPERAQAAWRYALTLDPDDATARARLGE